jgi:5-methylcytosine-specific restriction endonuclease McrA
MPDDAHFAPRACLSPHPPASRRALGHLANAADAAIAGNTEAVRDALMQADMPELRGFALGVMGKLDPHIHRYRKAAPANRPRAKHADRMPPRAAWMSFFHRDGFHCRFCGIPVVHPGVRTRLRAIAPDVVPGGRSATYHAAFLALNATLDHVIPHAAGGDNDPDNIVTTCWPCNFGRGSYSLAELGLNDPRLRPPVVTDWDGLTRVLGPTGKTRKALAMPNGRIARAPSCAWRDAVDAIHPGAARHLVALATACAPIGVDHTIARHFALRLVVGPTRITPIAVHSDGTVTLSWSIGPHKDAMHPFAKRIAMAIPGARLIENPSGWTVGLGGKRSLPVDALLTAEVEVVAALMELRASIRRAV